VESLQSAGFLFIWCAIKGFMSFLSNKNFIDREKSSKYTRDILGNKTQEQLSIKSRTEGNE
jgi:hypothetical protein